MKKKICYNLILLLLMFLFLLVFAPIIGCHKTWQESRCLMGLKLYKNRLIFKNFYKSNFLYGFLCKKEKNVEQYEILADYMHIFNKEYKLFNKTEDRIIDQNLEKAKKIFPSKI